MQFLLWTIDSGEDNVAHWFLVQLLSMAGEVLDTDRFRWVKSTKRPTMNPYEGSDQPPGWKPRWGRVRESNVFDYKDIADVASRHFMRRQGLVPGGKTRGAKGRLAWTPASWTKVQGADIVLPEQAQRHIPFLAQRDAAMRGAILEITAPDISGELRKVNGHIGTVSTISNNLDGRWDTGDFCSDGAQNTFLGTDPSNDLRGYFRFSLSSISATDTIDNVEFKFNVNQVRAAPYDCDIQAYDQDGQADPGADTCAQRGTRCFNDATPYLDQTGDLDSTGIKTLDLGTDADTDVEAAKDAVDRFSLAINENGMPGGIGEGPVVEGTENAGTEEARLVVTHSAPAVTFTPRAMVY